MSIVTKEVNTSETPLRRLVDEHKDVLREWRIELKDQLPDPVTWLRPPNPSRASITGLAVDYRACWFLTGVGELPLAVRRGLALCSKEETATAVIREFDRIQGLDVGAHDAATELLIARAAVACATVEPLYRRGPIVACPIDQLGWSTFVHGYQDVIDDAARLAEVLPHLLGSEIGKGVTPSPDLRTGTLKGDGDLMIDATLIEIKCVSDPMSESSKTLRQLLVYAARSRVTAVCLVLPRQRLRVDFDLVKHREMLDNLDTRIVAAYA